ncbi:MAG: hypothetical protein WAV93_10935 [Bacteroidales bacterium]
MPYFLIFVIMGIASAVWFLVRVIPKPSRAAYPCMMVAAPFMSGFVTCLLAVLGLTAISRKACKRIINVRYGATLMLLTGVIIAMATSPANSTVTTRQTTETRTGPQDGPNQPFGEAKGIFPCRVVWVWNADATNEKFEHNDFDASVIDEKHIAWFLTDQGIVSYDNTKWTLHNKNRKIISDGFRGPILMPSDTVLGIHVTGDDLSGNNILTLAVDKDDVAWIGNDNGVTRYSDRIFTVFG